MELTPAKILVIVVVIERNKNLLQLLDIYVVVFISKCVCSRVSCFFAQ